MNDINEGTGVCEMKMNQDSLVDGKYELRWYLWWDMKTNNEGIK